MDILKLKNELLTFLKSKDVYDRYIAAISKQYGCSTASSRTNQMSELFGFSPEECISMSFCWADTAEGYLYWNCISNDWKSYIQPKKYDNTQKYNSIW